uniref:Putative tRNA nucleotidyltransferase n=1 Tax=Trypanosoma congolense (strain IL3000) TaxID=1068625 RepID=G0UU48_TRYCI|nr:putative tRNA nucleotidyltransferase [Trypanosoma congolense IL3000]
MNLPRKVTLNKPILGSHLKIFEFLLRVNEERNINATLRVAGGWVRDSLLGLHSQDIDIAIESPTHMPVSGEAFAREVASYQESLGLKARTVSVIRVNPELSKHIETATVCVYDTPVEFCALRHDEYTNPDSRIPAVRPATAMEDAMRRDYTINALFYNLHTKEVEDYVTGLEDLAHRVLRCPLDPRETFSDDPLRLLRGIRFVGQLGELGFVLDEVTLSCVDDDLLQKVAVKVSRERIGKEVAKMLSGPFPERCVEIMYKLSILQEILLVEIYFKSGKKGQSTAEVERMEYLARGGEAAGRGVELVMLLCRTLVPLFSRSGSQIHLAQDSSDRLVSMVFVCCLGFYRGVDRDQIERRLYALCVNGLKLPVSLLNAVCRMVMCYNTLKREQLSLSDITEGTISREAKLAIFSGLYELNDKRIMPSAFNVVFAAYFLVECRSDLLSSSNVGEAAHTIDRLLLILGREPGLLDAFSRPLPVKGNELAKMFPLEPQQIGPALLELRRNFMLYPNSTRDDVVQWLQRDAP